MDKEELDFNAKMEAARRYLRDGRPEEAVPLVASSRWTLCHRKYPEGFTLLRELYEHAEPQLTEEGCRRNRWQLELLAELYQLWPKLRLEGALLKHSFPEPAREEFEVGGAEAVHVAESSYGVGIMQTRPVVLSRGRRWLKLWDLATGRVIYTYDAKGMTFSASAIGRDASHMMFAQGFEGPAGEALWTVSRRQTLREVSFFRSVYGREGFEGASYYRLKAEVVGVDRDKGLVRLRYEAVGDSLPEGTVEFPARVGEREADILQFAGRVTATVGTHGDQVWLEEIIADGLGLLGINGGFDSPVTALCLSSDGNLAAANGGGNEFGIWHVWTGDRLRTFRGHASRVNCLCLSTDAGFVVSGAEDKTVRLWESYTAECVRVLEGHESALSAVCVSLDGTRIFSADRGGVVKLWDSATGECLLTIRAHAQHVSSVRLTADGRFAASAGHDKTVKLWNLCDGSCMKTLEHADWVTGVDLTPDGAYLISSSYEGTKVWELVWRMEPRDLAEWDEGARPLLEMLMKANGAWAGTLGTQTGMYERQIAQALRRESPSWVAWHTPSKGLWHLGWDISEALGQAGYGWLTGAGREGSKLMDEWAREHSR
jgi:WD40 repeat protein